MNQTAPIRAACLQMSSTGDVDENLNYVEEQLSRAQKIDLLVLPENFAQMPKRRSEQHIEQPDLSLTSSKVQRFLLDIAARFDMHIVGGSVPIIVAENEKPYARCLLVNANGCIGHYDKLHLFDVEVQEQAGRQRYCESDTYQAGDLSREQLTPHALTIGANTVRLGASICYDLRFAELYRGFAQQGVDIICVPSAFTYDTGKAHWDVLLRARAIENQAFVLAPAQVGVHENGRQTWGHSMIIDPWGKVLAQQSTTTGLLYADLYLNHIDTLKNSFPTLAHTRLSG